MLLDLEKDIYLGIWMYHVFSWNLRGQIVCNDWAKPHKWRSTSCRQWWWMDRAWSSWVWGPLGSSNSITRNSSQMAYSKTSQDCKAHPTDNNSQQFDPVCVWFSNVFHIYHMLSPLVFSRVPTVRWQETIGSPRPPQDQSKSHCEALAANKTELNISSKRVPLQNFIKPKSIIYIFFNVAVLLWAYFFSQIKQ